jgi:hypothetical protein
MAFSSAEATGRSFVLSFGFVAFTAAGTVRGALVTTVAVGAVWKVAGVWTVAGVAATGTGVDAGEDP